MEKYISFRPNGKERFVRGSNKSLGENYTKERILERIETRKQDQLNAFTHDKGIRKLIKIKSSTPLDGNSGLQQWATKENLKIAVQTYNAM